MATYDDKRKEFSRIPVWYVKLTLDFCAETFGAAPCVAVGTADKKCLNTFFTCKDSANYNLTSKVYRFCTNGELPFNDGERPYIQSVIQLPTEIKESLPVLGRIKVMFYDEPDTDVGIDPYISERTSAQGQFWRKLLKRNPNYKGRSIQVYEGFIGIPESEFQLRFDGNIDNIRFANNGMVEVEGKDYIGDINRVKLPPEYDIKIGFTVSSAAQTVTFTGADVDQLVGESTGETIYLRVSDEIMSYASSNYNINTNQVTGMTRGAVNTNSSLLAENDNVTITPHYNGNIFDVMHELLVNASTLVTNPGAALSTANVATTSFTFWRDFSGISTEVIVDGFIDEGMSVADAYFDLANLMDVKTWVGEDNKINIARRVPNLAGRSYHKLSDDANIVLNTDALDQNEKSRYTRNYLSWDYLPASNFDLGKNFRRTDVLVDLDLESSNAFGEEITQADKTRFFRQGIMSQDAQNRFVQNRQRRWMQIRRNAQEIVDVTLEYKDSNILTGEYCKMNTDIFTDDLGNSISSAICQVIKRHVSNNKVMLRLEKQPDNKVCFIGPTSAAGGSSAFTVATDAQLNYGFIAAADSASSTAAVMDDGKAAYLIY